MKKTLLFSLFLSSVFSFAQVSVTAPGPFTFNGASFALLYDAGDLQGTLTSVTINATLDASIGSTYADDLTVAITDSNSLATAEILFQGGGYSNFGAPDRQPWPNGASNTPGTLVSGTITLATPINFTANPAYAIFLGNGYANANPPTNSGTWSNISITLNGVTETPASSDDFIASTFTIYPNPTSNILNVSGNNLPIRKLGIADINGRAIKTIVPSISSEQMNIDVSDLSAGVYLLVIDTEEGNAVKKFIKN